MKLDEIEFACFDNSVNREQLISLAFPNEYRTEGQYNGCAGEKDAGGFVYDENNTCGVFSWNSSGMDVELMEISMKGDLKNNRVRIHFPALLAKNGVYVHFVNGYVAVCAVTVANTVHRILFKKMKGSSLNLDSSACPNGEEFQSPIKWSGCIEQMDQLKLNLVQWCDESHVVLGCMDGHIVVNEIPSMHQGGRISSFSMAGQAMRRGSYLKRNGILNSVTECIIAMAVHQMKKSKDFMVVTMQANGILRFFSIRDRTCIRTEDAVEILYQIPPKESTGVLNAKLQFIQDSALSGDDYRLMLHLSLSPIIWLFHGKISPNQTKCSLSLLRQFGLPMESSDQQKLELITIASNGKQMYSLWKSKLPDQLDFVVSHARPLSLTGPDVILGEFHNTMTNPKRDISNMALVTRNMLDGIQVLTESIIMTSYLHAILQPGVFSKTCLNYAMRDYMKGENTNNRLDIGIESDKDKMHFNLIRDAILARVRSNGFQSEDDRLIILEREFYHFTERCIKYWCIHSQPIGLLSAEQHVAIPTPVFVLRKVFVSILVPSTVLSIKCESSRLIVPRDLKFTTLNNCSEDVMGIADSEFAGLFRNEEITLKHFITESFFLHAASIQSGESTFNTLTLEVLSAKIADILRVKQPIGAANISSFFVMSKLLAPNLQHDTLVALGDTIAFPEDKLSEQPSMDSNNQLEYLRGMYQGKIMANAMHHIFTSAVRSVYEHAIRTVFLFAYLYSSGQSFISFENQKFIKNELLPTAVNNLHRWAHMNWMSNSLTFIGYNLDMDGGDVSLSRTRNGQGLAGAFFQNKYNSIQNNVMHGLHASSNVHAGLVRQLRTGNAGKATERPEYYRYQLLNAYCSAILEQMTQIRSDSGKNNMVTYLRNSCCYENLYTLLTFESQCSNDVDTENPLQDQVATFRSKFLKAECCLGLSRNALGNTCRIFSRKAVDLFLIAIHALYVVAETSKNGDDVVHAVRQALELMKRNFPAKNDDLIVSFALRQIQLLRSMVGFSNLADEAISFLWLNVFKHSIDTGNFALSHQSLRHLADPIQGQCIRRLVTLLSSAGEVEFLCNSNWGASTKQVVQVLEWQASNSDVLAASVDFATARNADVTQGRPSYYHILYSFFMHRMNHVRAAESMHALQLRLKLEMQPGDHTAMLYRESALSICLAGLSLVANENQWVFQHANKGLKIVQLCHLKRELAIVNVKLALAQKGVPLHSCINNNLSIHDLCRMLLKSDKMELALSICLLHDLDLDYVFEFLSKKCMTNNKWDELESMLNRFDSTATNFRYHSIAVKSIIQADTRFQVPHWLIESYLGHHSKSSPNRKSFAKCNANPSSLLFIFLESGMLLEACQLLDQLLPSHDESSKHAGNFVSIQDYNNVKTSTEWFPYTLIDQLLHQCRIESQKSPSLHFAFHNIQARIENYLHFLHAAQRSSNAKKLADTYAP